MHTGRRAEQLPEPPVIVATELADARDLLGDQTLTWLSGHAVCRDLAVEHRRGDPFAVVDLQEAGWWSALRPPIHHWRRKARS